MPAPQIKNWPVEIFGHPFTNISPEATKARVDQYCPFLGEECKKPRKSQPHIKTGICTLGYKGRFLSETQPVIVCPYRFNVPWVFETLEGIFLPRIPRDHRITWVPEVSLGGLGSIDYVAAVHQLGTRRVVDYMCVEFQAGGTTGTPFDAVTEFMKNGRFSQDRYGYGINWANEFQKTMMQQAYKKGKAFEAWRKRIVFVVQDLAMSFLRSVSDAGGLHAEQSSDPILFYTLKMVWDDAKATWGFSLVEKLSTNTEGIRRMLGGPAEGNYLTEADFRANISRKMERSSPM